MEPCGRNDILYRLHACGRYNICPLGCQPEENIIYNIFKKTTKSRKQQNCIIIDYSRLSLLKFVFKTNKNRQTKDFKGSGKFK